MKGTTFIKIMILVGFAWFIVAPPQVPDYLPTTNVPYKWKQAGFDFWRHVEHKDNCEECHPSEEPAKTVPSIQPTCVTNCHVNYVVKNCFTCHNQPPPGQKNRWWDKNTKGISI